MDLRRKEGEGERDAVGNVRQKREEKEGHWRRDTGGGGKLKRCFNAWVPGQSCHDGQFSLCVQRNPHLLDCFLLP